MRYMVCWKRKSCAADSGLVALRDGAVCPTGTHSPWWTNPASGTARPPGHCSVLSRRPFRCFKAINQPPVDKIREGIASVTLAQPVKRTIGRRKCAHNFIAKKVRWGCEPTNLYPRIYMKSNHLYSEILCKTRNPFLCIILIIHFKVQSI